MQRAGGMLIGVHCSDQKMNTPLTCWRMTTQSTTVELIKRINQKIDSPGKNKEKGMAGAHADTDVQKSTLKQYGDSTKTQKTIQSKIQFSTVTKETTMKSKVQKLQKEISRPKSKRIPQGFSLRKEIPKSGQKPI